MTARIVAADDRLIWSPAGTRRVTRRADGGTRLVDLGCYTLACAQAFCRERGLTLEIWAGQPRVSVGSVVRLTNRG